MRKAPVRQWRRGLHEGVRVLLTNFPLLTSSASLRRVISPGVGHPPGMRLGEVERLRGELSEFVADVFASVPRRDQRRWGECYLRGLMLDGRRKSVQPMAERLPDGNMQALQQFVNQSPWDPLPVRRRIAERCTRRSLLRCG
jgi:hypothetical protein